MDNNPDSDERQRYYNYLIELRDSGRINMMGADAELSAEFGLSPADARVILFDWMNQFSDDEPEDYE